MPIRLPETLLFFDEDTIRHAEFAAEFNKFFEVDPRKTDEIENHVEEFLKNKQPGQVDSSEVQMIKALIRRE